MKNVKTVKKILGIILLGIIPGLIGGGMVLLCGCLPFTTGFLDGMIFTGIVACLIGFVFLIRWCFDIR